MDRDASWQLHKVGYLNHIQFDSVSLIAIWI